MSTNSSETRAEDVVTNQNENAATRKISSYADYVTERAKNNPFLIASTNDTITKRSKVPLWLAAHINARDLKTWFRCSVALWVAFLLVLINPSLRTFGTASFFAPVVLLMIPPSGILLVYILGAATLIIGMALGWAWGVLVMMAALATRPAAETNARLQQLGAAAQGNITNPSQSSGQAAYAQVLIFEGFMLDTRVVITYFCMLGLFIYFMCRLKAAFPKLTLTAIFAIVVSDIFLTTAPLLPSFQGTIPKVLIQPAATGIGIGVACSLLFFPRSTSQTVLDDIQMMLSPFKELLNAILVSLDDPKIGFSAGKLAETRAATAAAAQGLEASFNFLPLDVSIGRISAGDLLGLKDALRHVTTIFLSTLQLQLHRVEGRAKAERVQQFEEKWNDTAFEKRPELLHHGHHQWMGYLDLRRHMHHDHSDDLFLQSHKALLISCGEMLISSVDALEAIIQGINHLKESRWFNKSSGLQVDDMRTRHSACLEQIRSHKNAVEIRTLENLMQPHRYLFDRSGNLSVSKDRIAPPLHGLIFGMIVESKLHSVADALEQLLSQILQLEESRKSIRLWLPMKLSHAGTVLMNNGATPGIVPISNDVEQKKTRRHRLKEKKRAKEDKKRTEKERAAGTEHLLAEMSFHAGHKRGSFANVVHNVSDWLSNGDGLYALRVLFVSIALALPAVLRSSAGFYYREKGLWALIMAQTGLTVFSADFVYGTILKAAGTLAGGVLGMVCWYIGAGHGPGNPHGMAAILALVLPALMWARLFASPALLNFFIIMATTSFIVVGYSWDDTHIPSYGNPSVGWHVFYQRTLLVLIGFLAAALVTFIPRPPSATRHYCKVLAHCLERNKDLYALFVTTWRSPPDDLRTVSEHHSIATAETLAAAAGPINLLRFEFVPSNVFDTATLSRVTALATTINESLAQLLVAVADPAFPPLLRRRFALSSGALDSAFIGDFMALITLVEQALRTGEPLPAVLPGPLAARWLKSSVPEPLHIDTIKPGFGQYCIVLGAFVQMTGAVDELVHVVKGAVGETQVLGLDLGAEEESLGLLESDIELTDSRKTTRNTDTAS